MSKLDYVTIAIVGICIMAILFLVYKMTNVFSGDKAKDKTEIATDSVETEDEDVYDYEIDQNVDSTAATTGGAASDNTATTKPASKTETTASDSPAEDDVQTTEIGGTNATGTTASDAAEKPAYSQGKYMVLAGSFSQKAFADAQVKDLKKLGYKNAQVEIFDRGKYAVVLVDRFNNMAEAERLVKKLGSNGVKSYVKTKS